MELLRHLIRSQGMGSKSKDHRKAFDRTVLPGWMFWGVPGMLLLLFAAIVVAISDGRDDTGVEQSPFRNVPEEVLSSDE